MIKLAVEGCVSLPTRDGAQLHHSRVQYIVACYYLDCLAPTGSSMGMGLVGISWRSQERYTYDRMSLLQQAWTRCGGAASNVRRCSNEFGIQKLQRGQKFSLVIWSHPFFGIYFVYKGTNIMSFEMVRAENLFCHKYIYLELIPCVLENIDDISRNLFKYTLVNDL